MLTIHYSPSGFCPDNIPNICDLIKEHGKEWLIRNFPTSGDIATNDSFPLAIAGMLIRSKEVSCLSIRIIEYFEECQGGTEIQFDDNGHTIPYLFDDDSYQFHCRFSDSLQEYLER